MSESEITIASYSIYHSANSYIGVVLAQRGLADLPVRVDRFPIFIPKERGRKVADLQGRSESPALSSYHREDCVRWAARHGIELRFKEPGIFEEWANRWARSPFGREELPARAFYAALGTGKEHLLDQAFFRASYVDLLDVNEEPVIRDLAASIGLDPDALLERAGGEESGRLAQTALAQYLDAGCPGVPTWVVAGERFWGKDRVDWLRDRVVQLLEGRPTRRCS